MKNWQKFELRDRVALSINAGNDMATCVKDIRKHGFLPATIRRYYKALSGK